MGRSCIILVRWWFCAGEAHAEKCDALQDIVAEGRGCSAVP